MRKALTEKQQKLLALFRAAIEKEREAQKDYTAMLDYVDGPTLKRVIESFIEQEKRHEKILMEKYSELRETDEFNDAT
ncbi:MAG: ferritin family protein [Thermoleophilia bacterium]